MHSMISALDRRNTPLRLFFRDDDAGWAQDRLDAMLSVFHLTDTPIDLAVIPAVLTADGADLLNQWRGRHAGIGLHQHGYAHTNHEPDGARKCEFGQSRPVERQCADIAMGRDRLAGLLGTVDPIFTPPWNRCARATVAMLPSWALRPIPMMAARWNMKRALSTCRSISTGTASADAKSLPGALTDLLGRPTDVAGIMLHHATMDAAALATFTGFLRAIRSHDNVEFVSMRDLKELAPCAN